MVDVSSLHILNLFNHYLLDPTQLNRNSEVSDLLVLLVFLCKLILQDRLTGLKEASKTQCNQIYSI